MKNFVSCHVHPKSLDSGSTPENFAKRELELGTGYVVATDHGTLEATRHIYDLCHGKKFKGLNPILGLEGYFRDDNCPILTKRGYQRTQKPSDTSPTFREHLKYMHITLHAMDEKAYFAMCRALSDADLRAEKHGSERKPLFSWETLESLGALNVTGTSGCLIGMVGRHLLQHNDPRTAVAYYEKVRSCFKPGNFFVEVFPHACDRNWESALIVTALDGSEHRYPTWKQFKTAKGIVKGEALASAFKADRSSAQKTHQAVMEVMENRAWTKLETPIPLDKVEKREGFLMNECRPWSPNGDFQAGINRFLLGMAARYKDPVLVSDDSHFAFPNEKVVQDIRLAQLGNWRFSNSYHRMTSDEAYAYFKDKMSIDQATFEGWVENTHSWADRFKDFKFSPRQSLPTSFYPADTLRHTMELVKRHGRMKWNDPVYVDRLKSEIELLYKNGTVDLLPYFMIDEEVCALYQKHGHLTGPGRGSAAGLLLAWLLEITHADPLKYRLSKDRFLTLDRIETGKMPDIDQDLPDRTLLVGEDGNSGWLKKRFGECVSGMSTDTTMKVKSAIKDVFRATYGHVSPAIEATCKALPNPPQGVPDRDYILGYKDSEGAWQPGLIESNATLKEFAASHPTEWETVKMLLGLPRQRSRHACGFAISDTPIHDFIPLTTVGDVRVTSFTAADVEASGVLKMDFLVVNSVDDVEKAVRLIQDRYGHGIDWRSVRDGTAIQTHIQAGSAAIPLVRAVPYGGRWVDIYDLPEDPDVFRDICEGKVEGVFQLDASEARRGLGSFRPLEDGTLPLNSIEGLSAFTALDRPGGLDARVKAADGSEHDMLVEYANRVKGLPRSGSMPVLDELLPETYGVIVYQEQLQYLFQEIGGSTAIEANNFRQRAAKKKMVEVDAIDRPLFMKGAVARLGVEDATRLWDMMKTWAQYGFNKSHAVCYMLTAYACAWLKHHFPLEWWTAVLSNADRNDIDEKFWGYCGHLILLPDIKYSKETFVIEGDKIRAPLSLLHGIGEKAHELLVSGAPYETLDSLLNYIEGWRNKNATTVVKEVVRTVEGEEENPKTVQVERRQKAVSPINGTVLRNMVISGVMDGLFPAESEYGGLMTTTERLTVFEEKFAKSKGSKKVKPTEGFDAPLVRYQYRKAVLPAYTEPLKETIVGIYGISPTLAKRKWLVVSGSEYMDLKQAEEAGLLPPVDMDIAVPAYVLDQRVFTYRKNDVDKTACELTLDMDGKQISMVRWPGKEGLPSAFKESLKGSVLVCLLSRSPKSTGFFFVDVHVTQSPLKKKESKEESP